MWNSSGSRIMFKIEDLRGPGSPSQRRSSSLTPFSIEDILSTRPTGEDQALDMSRKADHTTFKGKQLEWVANCKVFF